MQEGSSTPFESELAHTDIFTFKESGEVDGVPVLRYSSNRAREVWPREVISVSGWYADGPTVSFGGYVMVRSLPALELDWCVKTAYGPRCLTHDGSGNPIVDFSCALHSSKIGDLERGPAVPAG